MSGDGKRGDGHRPPATAPIFDSTNRDDQYLLDGRLSGARLMLSCKRKTAAADLQPTFDGADRLAYRELFAMDLLPACAKV